MFATENIFKHNVFPQSTAFLVFHVCLLCVRCMCKTFSNTSVGHRNVNSTIFYHNQHEHCIRGEARVPIKLKYLLWTMRSTACEDI